MKRVFPLPFFLVAVLVAFGLVSAPAWAAPGELAGVLAHCGAPATDVSSVSEVNNLPERSLGYGNLRLNFQQLQGAEAGGWSFTTAWKGHLPVTEEDLEARMPCFRDGMEEADVRYQNALSRMDPGIAEQSAAKTQPHGAFGITHLWLILFLGGIIGIFALAIPSERRLVNGPNPADRPFRKPRLPLIRARRQPRIRPDRN